MSLNNIRQKNKKPSNPQPQPSTPALQRHSNTRFPPPPPSQTAPKTSSSPYRRRIPDERAVPFTQCPSPIYPTSSSRLRLSTIVSSGNAVEGETPPAQSVSPMTTRSNPGVQRQNITSRPPLPPNKKNSANAAFAWATQTTPRMRVPLTNQSGSSTGTSAIAVKKSSEIEEIADKFHFNRPGQVYRGPTTITCNSLATDGSEPLKWFPFRNSTHLLKPPPPPLKIIEDIQGRQPDPPPQPPQLSAEQHTSLKNLLQAARRLAPLPAQQQEPWGSEQGTPLLTSPSEGPEVGSSSPSFPSNNTLGQLEQATIHQNLLQRPHSVGPFVNNGIPNEIQDDLLRIELLLGLGLEKYKEAINQKIQNHNQIIQLVQSRSSQLNAQQSQSQQKFLTKYPHPPYPYPHYPLQPQQQVYPAIMDIDIQQSNTGNVDGGEELSIPNVAKPVWSNHHTAEPFNAPNFTLNTFMEPHPPEASMKGDQNANDQNPISLLKPINFDDFQAMAEQSRSGFQSSEGMEMQQQQNPLIAGAMQYESSHLPYHFNQIHPRLPGLKLLEPEVTKATPLIIQVEPRKESPPSQEQENPELPRKQSTVQQQYQEFLQQDESNMKDLSPNSFKILEQPVDLMPRKPVAVAKGLPRSPSNLFPTEGLTIVKANEKPNTAKPNSPAVSPPPTARGGTKKINLDKPSPFFPGFSDKPIQMKIKSPRTRTGGSSTGGQTITSVTSVSASRKLEGVEELGNLLSKLPVLSRQQKVEEFQAFSTIKPETPLTEVDSETSMIPLVSSNGTLVSDRRPNSGQRGRRRVATISGDSGGGGSLNVEVSEGVTTDEEYTSLDTNKMTINELVTLGRKIYRILSQLSTNSNSQTSPPMTTQQPKQEPRSPNQVYTAPVTLNVPSPNTPVFTPKAKSIKTRGSTNKAQGLPVSPALIVDFNSMPNPTFITGPGVNLGKSTPKLISSSKNLGGSRTASQQQLPPNLFRNFVKPPPTRWGDNGKMSAKSVKKKPNKGRKISRRSTSSMMSAPRASARAGTPAGKKSRPTFQQNEQIPIPKTMPKSFTVRENYNNNYTRKSSARYKRRQPTPYPYPNHMDNPNPSGMTINSTAGSAYRSPGRRNFIQENINKAAMMRQRQDSKVRPRKLPPVENYYRKIWDSVQSKIPGSRSRSNSMHRLHHHPRREKSQLPNHPDYLPAPPHDVMMRRANEHNTRSVVSRGGFDNKYRRSSSVPTTSHTAYSNSPHPSHHQPQRSSSTPRPSTGLSVNMASSSNRSESSIPQNNQNHNSNQISRPSSQGILKSSTTLNAKSVKPKNGASKVKFENIPSTASDDNAAPAPAPSPEEKDSQLARKSRSKTKRTSNLVEKKAPISNNQNQSSASSPETQPQVSPPPPPTPQPQPKKKILRVKPKPKPKGNNRKQVTKAENVSTDNSDNNEQNGKLKKPVFNSESDQKIIRNAVKEEMHLMVNKKVKKSMNKLKHRSTSSKKSAGGRGEEGFIKRRIDLDEEVDEGGDTDAEPSFKSGLRHRPVNSPVEREDIDSGDITPVYTPPKFYDESLFSLEKWVNPDTVPPGSAYTSENDTPAVKSTNIKDDHHNSVYGVVGGRVRSRKLGNNNITSTAKQGIVRFSLPTVTNQMKIKKRAK